MRSRRDAGQWDSMVICTHTITCTAPRRPYAPAADGEHRGDRRNHSQGDKHGPCRCLASRLWWRFNCIEGDARQTSIHARSIRRGMHLNSDRATHFHVFEPKRVNIWNTVVRGRQVVERGPILDASFGVDVSDAQTVDGSTRGQRRIVEHHVHQRRTWSARAKLPRFNERVHAPLTNSGVDELPGESLGSVGQFDVRVALLSARCKCIGPFVTRRQRKGIGRRIGIARRIEVDEHPGGKPIAMVRIRTCAGDWFRRVEIGEPEAAFADAQATCAQISDVAPHVDGKNAHDGPRRRWHEQPYARHDSYHKLFQAHRYILPHLPRPKVADGNCSNSHYATHRDLERLRRPAYCVTISLSVPTVKSKSPPGSGTSVVSKANPAMPACTVVSLVLNCTAR